MPKINSRQKGKRGERMAADYFRRIFKAVSDSGESVVQRLQQSRGAKDGPDVVAGCFWVESKFVDKITAPLLRNAVAQALGDQSACAHPHYRKLIPIVWAKANREDPIVVLPWAAAELMGLAVDLVFTEELLRGSRVQVPGLRLSWAYFEEVATRLGEAEIMRRWEASY